MKMAKDLTAGDVFIHEGHTNVAIGGWENGYIWVTNEEVYTATENSSSYGYGPTNSYPMQIEADVQVEYLKNIKPAA